MFVFRMALSVTVSMMALGGAACATPEGEKNTSGDARPTKAQAVTAADDKPKKAAGDTQTRDPMAEYRNREKTWCDKRPVEIQKEDYPDGKPRYKYEVVMNEEGEFVRHGKSTTWWETGNKKLDMRYVCGVKHGAKRTWWKDGSKWSVGGFYEGKDNGTWIVWDNQGVKSKQYRIVKGSWQGLFTVWHPNGQKRLEVEYLDGQRQGNLNFWDEHGNVLRTIEYLDGVEQPMPGA